MSVQHFKLETSACVSSNVSNWSFEIELMTWCKNGYTGGLNQADAVCAWHCRDIYEASTLGFSAKMTRVLRLHWQLYILRHKPSISSRWVRRAVYLTTWRTLITHRWPPFGSLCNLWGSCSSESAGWVAGEGASTYAITVLFCICISFTWTCRNDLCHANII